MKVYSILVHPNQVSLNSQMFDMANSYFKKQGHTVKTINLYQDATDIKYSSSELYQNTASSDEKGLMSDYNYNYAVAKFKKLTSNFVNDEIANLKQADIVYIQSPILVWSLPAMLKLYIENVFIANEMFVIKNPWADTDFEIEKLMKDKRVIFSLTAGSSQSLTNYVIGSTDLLLHPIKSMFEFVGFEWVAPHITWGTTRTHTKQDQYLEDFQLYLKNLKDNHGL